MRLGLTIVLIVAFVVLSFARDSALAADQAFFEAFIGAVRERNYEEIARYVLPRERFFNDGALKEDIDRFVYDGGWVRRFDPEGRSVIEVVSIGPYEISSVEQADGKITFYLVPEIYSEEADQGVFFNDQWMKKYIACEFWPVGGEYKMLQSFCFAESGGPHQPPYG